MYLKALFDLSTSMIFFSSVLLKPITLRERRKWLSYSCCQHTHTHTQKNTLKKNASLPISVLFFGLPWCHTLSVLLLDHWLFLLNLCCLIHLCWHWASFIPSSPRARKFIDPIVSVTIWSGEQSKGSGTKQQLCNYAHIFYVPGSRKGHREEGLRPVGMICRLGITCSLRARIGWQFDHSHVWTRRPRPVTVSWLPQGMSASGYWYFLLGGSEH